MRLAPTLILACAAFGLAACQNGMPAPAQVSNATRTSSGLSSTGSASMQGGPLAATPGTGSVTTKTVQ